MAGYSSDDGDYYSDGGWGEEDNGGYYSDDHSEQQEFSDYDNVGESHEGTGREDNHEEQDDDEGSYDENEGKCKSMFTVVIRSSTEFLLAICLLELKFFLCCCSYFELPY